MSAYAFPLLIKQLLVTPLAQATRAEIVYRDRVRLTYQGFRDRVGRLGSVVGRLGAGPGTRVAFMDWDSHRYLEAYFAVPMTGAVLMMVNVRLAPEQIAYTLDHSEAEILFTHTDFLPLLDKVGPLLPRLRHVVCLTDDGAVPEGHGFAGEYEALLAEGDPAHDFPDFDENTVATTFYTTGTVGQPKGVAFSHRQLVLHTLTCLGTMALSGLQGRMSREDVYMPLTPMFHVHGWGFPYVATLAGMKQVYPGRYAPDFLLQLIGREGVTFSHCVPTILHMLLSAPNAAATDLSRWKVLIGGSALPRGLALAAMRRGIDIAAGYGMSETCPVLSIAQLKGAMLDGTAPDDEGTVDIRIRTGLPVVLAQIRIVDEAMRDMPHDGVSAGEVVVRAPYLTQRYTKDEAGTAQLWRDGWLHTGDIGVIDGDGYLRIVDRVKDVIKTGGEWVSSLAIEDALSQHPGVSEAAVIGVADARWGERPLALVVPRPGEAVDEAALRAHLEARAASGAISRYAVPDRILLVEALEKTSVGKLDKKAMRARLPGTPPAAAG